MAKINFQSRNPVLQVNARKLRKAVTYADKKIARAFTKSKIRFIKKR